MGKKAEKNLAYIDTPKGIFSARGIWFHTCEDSLRTYAKPLLEHRSLNELIEQAERWLHSPATIALWLWPLWLRLWPLFWAMIGLVVAYLIYAWILPVLVTHVGARILRYLEYPVLQVLFYAVTLGPVAANGQYEVLVAGLVGFLVIRWRWLDRVLMPVVRKLWDKIYHYPVPDKVLKMVIVREAIHYRVDLPEIVEMETSIIEQLPK